MQEILDKLEKMTALELAELVKAIEEKFGVTAAAPTMVAAGAADSGAAAEEEKTEFDVVLLSAGDKKIQVIKVVREITGLGLKEAKAIVDATGTIKEAVAKEEAEKMKEQIEEAGGQVDLK